MQDGLEIAFIPVEYGLVEVSFANGPCRQGVMTGNMCR
jgi:hypothetical protein